MFVFVFFVFFVFCYVVSVSGVSQQEYIVLSARVHPGESNSSWIMRGMTMQWIQVYMHVHVHIIICIHVHNYMHTFRRIIYLLWRKTVQRNTTQITMRMPCMHGWDMNLCHCVF